MRKILHILIVLGFMVSAFLAYEYEKAGPISCLGGIITGCETVKQSEYSVLFGIKVPYWGMLYFVVLFVLTYFQKTFRHIQKYIPLIALSGLLFETYMTYLQLYVINAVCAWCLSIEVLMISIVIVASQIDFTDIQAESPV